MRFADQELDSLSKRENRRLRRRMGVIFQSPSRSLNPRTSIGDSIAEPLRANDGLTRVARGRVVRELIDRVQLPASVFTAYPSELSGGQLQRASIARALALEPSLLIADEPTSALDVSVQAEILELLAEIQHDSRFACLFISHDLPLVASFCNGILVLNKGKAVEAGGDEAGAVTPIAGLHTPTAPERSSSEPGYSASPTTVAVIRLMPLTSIVHGNPMPVMSLIRGYRRHVRRHRHGEV
jgi:peptide/nickel transport system ATP-binding protein